MGSDGGAILHAHAPLYPERVPHEPLAHTQGRANAISHVPAPLATTQAECLANVLLSLFSWSGRQSLYR